MGTQKTLSHNEKLEVVAKIMGQMELAGARGYDGFDILMVVAHLLFPGQAVDLRVCNLVREF
jgi:hypothetical protein